MTDENYKNGWRDGRESGVVAGVDAAMQALAKQPALANAFANGKTVEVSLTQDGENVRVSFEERAP